jgi:hypothetical protein
MAATARPGAYYLVNNYNAGFSPAGELATLGPKVPGILPQAEPAIAGPYQKKG